MNNRQGKGLVSPQRKRDFGKERRSARRSIGLGCVECKERPIAVERFSLCFGCYAKEHSTLKSYLKKRAESMRPKRDSKGRFIKRRKK